MKFKIPVRVTVDGWVTVEAENIDRAISIAGYVAIENIEDPLWHLKIFEHAIKTEETNTHTRKD